MKPMLGYLGLKFSEHVLRVAVLNDFVGYKAQRTGRLCACLVETDNRHACHICLAKLNALASRRQRYFSDKYVGVLQLILCIYVNIFRFVRQKEMMRVGEPGFFDGFIQLIFVIVATGMRDVNVHGPILSNNSDVSEENTLRNIQVCQIQTNAPKFGAFLPLLSKLAGDEGFEPPITGPEPVALPLGQSPIIPTHCSKFRLQFPAVLTTRAFAGSNRCLSVW